MSNPEMIQILVTEKVLKMNGQVYNEGNQVAFTPSDAKVICENGWGNAVNDELETGERIPGAKAIKVDDTAQAI